MFTFVKEFATNASALARTSESLHTGRGVLHDGARLGSKRSITSRVPPRVEAANQHGLIFLTWNGDSSQVDDERIVISVLSFT